MLYEFTPQKERLLSLLLDRSVCLIGQSISSPPPSKATILTHLESTVVNDFLKNGSANNRFITPVSESESAHSVILSPLELTDL